MIETVAIQVGSSVRRLRAEAALRVSEARYRMLANNASDVIWTMDLTGTFTYLSPSVQRLRGYTAEESMRQRPHERFTPQSLLHFREMMTKLVVRSSSQEPLPDQRAELEVYCKDGSTVWTEVISSAMYDAAGAMTGIMGVTRDISERRAMEQQIRQLNATLEQRVAERTAQLEAALADLQRAERVKDEFLAAVSHELRTPLAGVLGMADALELQYHDQFTERQLRYVRTIRTSGDRLLALVNSILDYTGLIAGRVTVRADLCQVADLCRSSLAAIQARAEQKDILVTFVIEPPDMAITTDSDGVKQVLNNLLDNAVKFTLPGGHAGLVASKGADATTVQLVVWDTGIGIDPADHERIFHPFVQADSSLARKYEGIGLGLPYAARMVELLRGTLTLESAPGEGSRFIVTLPMARGEPPTAV